MIQMIFWYDNEPYDKKDVKVIDIRCSNCRKEKVLSTNNMNTNYGDIITSFVLNTLLHHVGMSWLIKNHEELKYVIYEHNQDWITGGP